MENSSSLFRQEVVASRAESAFGPVTVLIPPSWQAIGFLLFFAVIAAIGFATTATYARAESVAGTIVPADGMAPIVPPRPGVLLGLSVSEGQMVKARQIVAFVRVEEDSTAGDSVGERIEQAIARQHSSAERQLKATQSSALMEQEQLAAQQAGLQAEITQIRSQMASQQILVTNAKHANDRAQSVASRGFISKRDLDALEDALVGREQVMAQLTQSLHSKRAQLAEVKRTADQALFRFKAQSAALESSRAEIEQEAAAARGNRSYTIRAPISGRVAALTARVGQPATSQTALMTIVPSSSPLRAELAVPSNAVGFVKRHQHVRLAVDSFPYQRFGTLPGKVLTVASSPVAQVSETGKAVAVYPVVVELESESVMAYGRRERLVPGMTLTARILTKRQTLLQWLFDPLFAVARR